MILLVGLCCFSFLGLGLGLLVSNPTLVKSSVNVPGISDHEIIITDFETKVHHQKTTPRKCYTYSKANWNTLKKDLNTLNEIVE
jgi:hypothetical protein